MLVTSLHLISSHGGRCLMEEEGMMVDEREKRLLDVMKLELVDGEREWGEKMAYDASLLNINLFVFISLYYILFYDILYV